MHLTTSTALCWHTAPSMVPWRGTLASLSHPSTADMLTSHSIESPRSRTRL
uniref:6-phosphofructokinase 2 n=1 Tax=Arundo donax TaxID=35708 RepID=A0A0A9EPM5_ARUDO